jgi:tetratricopeptide (TPR) repeat protein
LVVLDAHGHATHANFELLLIPRYATKANLRQLALKPGSDKKKLYDGVREAFEKAVGIRERYPEVYRQIGLVYLDENPRSSEATENFGKALGFYKEQKASKAVFEGFISEVAERYKKAGLKGNADAWVKEASVYMN